MSYYDVPINVNPPPSWEGVGVSLCLNTPLQRVTNLNVFETVLESALKGSKVPITGKKIAVKSPACVWAPPTPIPLNPDR